PKTQATSESSRTKTIGGPMEIADGDFGASEPRRKTADGDVGGPGRGPERRQRCRSDSKRHRFRKRRGVFESAHGRAGTSGKTVDFIEYERFLQRRQLLAACPSPTSEPDFRMIVAV